MEKDKPQNDLEAVKKLAAMALRSCGGRSIKSIDVLPPGGIAHEISVYPVRRRVKLEKGPQGDIPVVITEINKGDEIKGPIIRWLLTFPTAQGMLGFVQRMNQQCPELGFFVKDHRRYPLLYRDQFPDLSEELIKQVAAHGGHALREDRIAINARHCIVRLSCGYLSNEEGGSVEHVARDVLFAFPSLSKIRDFMGALKAVYGGMIALDVFVDQTPNLRPIPKLGTPAQGGGGGGGIFGGLFGNFGQGPRQANAQYRAA